MEALKVRLKMARKNYSKISEEAKKSKKTENNDTHVVSPELEEAVVNAGGEVMRIEEPTTVSFTEGVVTGCEKLFVRKEANKESNSLCIINKGSEVKINSAESTEDFYKVCTAAGVEGYCMKKFISIK